MIFGAERGSFTLIGALVAYTVVAGALGVVQRSQRLKEQRVRDWNNVFRGGAGSAYPLTRG